MEVDYYPGLDAVALAEECSAIHTAAFSVTGARGWTVHELKSLVERESTFLLKAAHGFLLADLVVDEVEILTIAVEPNHQGQKIGHALMSKLDDICACREVNKCLLEVAENNNAAVSLYTTFNFAQIAIREGYFKRGNSFVSALMMSKAY